MKNTFPTVATQPTLLLVTDFSEGSDKALAWAIPEAKRNHLHVSVLYPYRLDSLRRNDTAIMRKKSLEQEAAEKFEQRIEGMLKKNRISFDFHSEVGFLRDRVSERAKKSNVVMLVMGQKLAADSFPDFLEEMSIPLVIVPAG